MVWVSKTFTLEQKSGFKLERNKDLTFIVIFFFGPYRPALQTINPMQSSSCCAPSRTVYSNMLLSHALSILQKLPKLTAP